ncbi:hypothetical protein RM844_27535 [Streptomyces sp. DSM 44915]|uniref:Protein kilB n=1 Tax=Streptomyces chisholmiae TaxID=3075540 RepID=A0ABU2K0Q8_9ACTN|nr:hypothetical protein [Streptomyces sp. DSM 44915]MDT0270038.1 hypothetical protein [Streptomyces sp. DSM 44915]
MIATLLAVLGTLAGATVTGLLQHFNSSRADRRQRESQRRAALLEALVELQGAIVGHREQQYLKISDRRAGVPDTREAREARYAARTRLTGALDRLHLLTDDPELLAAAQEARNAAVALGDAPLSQTDQVGQRARETHTHLRQVAARRLA